ncbi:MAG: BMP family ABC transporter substrate-binding protein [Chitinispirillia bacterium]|nr:BMP family ABC transporter substrate-binding protein [Chitinispirillia bacterium]MCL2241506.1 BMP family ABC transporter substrate-binding protein [Chitinispirillia bacterium]
MIKLRLVVLPLLLAACLLCCQKGGSSSWVPGRPLPADSLVIGVIYVDGARNGYSLAHDLGIQAAQKELGLSDDRIIRKLFVNESGPAMVEDAIADAISEGANVIIAASWGQMDACEKLAAKHPGVVFANASGIKSNGVNFTNYFGRIYQARYLSGIAAGLKTKSGKIGYVAAQDKSNSEVTGGISAFAMGVESVNPEANVYVSVIANWYDPSVEAQSARRLIAAGCDVIAQHSNTPQPQHIAEKFGVWGIGYNVDMLPDAPKAVLTSVIWNWAPYYTSLLRGIINGTFNAEPYYGGLADGMVDITPLNPALAVPGMEEAVAAARKRILEGGFNIFEGEIATNDGKTAGKPGGKLSDKEITGGINWYYRNVVELK